MKVTIDIEWRKTEEPENALEYLLRDVLVKEGYRVGRVFVQGVWDEDKPKIAFSDGERLPHEEVAW